MFGWDFEFDAWSTFWRWHLIKICVWSCDMNPTLGSVMPLASTSTVPLYISRSIDHICNFWRQAQCDGSAGSSSWSWPEYQELWGENNRADSKVRLSKIWWRTEESAFLCSSSGKGSNFVATFISMFFFSGRETTRLSYLQFLAPPSTHKETQH